MNLSFAPMDGVTGAIYRRVHRKHFTGADRYYAPFIAPDAQGTFKLSHLRDVLPDNNLDIPLVPQILTNSAEAFLTVARKLQELGYEEVNLNAGCPSGTVVAKHKGAGMLSDLRSLDDFLADVYSRTPVKVSVKTRMGIKSTDEFEKILEIYNKYPISELTVHARHREGQYKSEVDVDGFEKAFRASKNPLAYNGDVFTVNDMETLKTRFPTLESAMIGRGAAANPAIFRMIKGGSPLTRAEAADFHAELLEETLATGMSGAFAAARMKELWFYMIHLFPDSAKEYKTLNKTRTLDDYKSAAKTILTACDFDGTAGFMG